MFAIERQRERRERERERGERGKEREGGERARRRKKREREEKEHEGGEKQTGRRKGERERREREREGGERERGEKEREGGERERGEKERTSEKERPFGEGGREGGVVHPHPPDISNQKPKNREGTAPLEEVLVGAAHQDVVVPRVDLAAERHPLGFPALPKANDSTFAIADPPWRQPRGK